MVDDCRRVGRSREFNYSQLRVSEGCADGYYNCADPNYPKGGILDLLCLAEKAARLAPDIKALVEELPKKQRKVVLMSLRDGMSNKEIAKMTGLNERTVSSHLAQGRKTLRKFIDRLIPDELQRRKQTHTRRTYAASAKGSARAPATMPRMQRVFSGNLRY